MRAMDAAISLCQHIDAPIKVYWVKEPDMNCAFTDLFEPIQGIELIERDPSFALMNLKTNLYDSRLHKLLSDWTILNCQDVKQLVHEQFDFRQLRGRNVLIASFVRFFPTAKMYDIFVPIKPLQQRIKEETALFNQHTIGIHIRRTDNIESIKHSPTELFERAIKQEILLNPEVCFYLASDCSDTKQQLFQKFGKRIITNFDQSDRTTKEGIQQALVELYALSHTQKIFGSYWSSFSHTAASINGISQIILYTTDTTKVETTTLSFCIACKNRLWQIKQTLPQNLKDNISMKGQINFVLVDFGSTDGLQEWIAENFEQEIQEGYLKYYYTEELKDWHDSIAKNTAHILSESDILVNLDCDNFTGKDGGKFVLDNMIKYGVHSTVIHQFSNKFGDGSYGRIALSKQNFVNIGGYDESFEPMDYQDKDLLIRLMIAGNECIHLGDSKYNQAIVNNKEEGIENTSSKSSWQEMSWQNYLLSKKNITSEKIIANIDKQHIGITRNVYKVMNNANTSDRTYWTQLAYRTAEPVLLAMSKGELKKNMPIELSPIWNGRSENVAYLEAFGRLIAGIAPWLALSDDDTEEGKQRKYLRELTLKCLANAVDPDNPDYMEWRKETQPLVDAAHLVNGFLRAPDTLWKPLDAVSKQRFVKELKGLRRIKPFHSNWLLFGAMIETFLLAIGEDYDSERIYPALRQIEKWYVGDGWYSDGHKFAFDYYNSFVIHPMYVEILEVLVKHNKIDAENFDIALQRMRRYATILERLISPEGTFPTFGRSITYRMAVFQPLSLLAWKYGLPQTLEYGQVRSSLTAVMKRLFAFDDIFNSDSFLQLGLAGHQPEIADYYTNTGSLYITSLVFLPLGLSANHPFWTGKAEISTAEKAWSGKTFLKDDAFVDSRVCKLIEKHSVIREFTHDAPLISVVMPVYNNEKYVSWAIESILKQSYKNFEFIIINDGSTDCSAEQIKNFDDKRIIFVNHSENRGNYRRRNEGLSIAKGKYICVMDADDEALPSRLATQVDFLEQNKSVLTVGSQFEFIGKGISNKPMEYEHIKAMLFYNNMFLHPSLMIRKSTLDEIGGYNEKYYYSSDYDLVCRLALKGEIRNLPDILMRYRVHDSQISTAKQKEQQAYANEIRAEYLKATGCSLNDKELALFHRYANHENSNNDDEKKELKAVLEKIPAIFGIITNNTTPLKMEQESHIRKLTDYILLNVSSVNSSGLYNGKTGMVLALFEVANYLQDESIYNRAFDLLQKVLVTETEDIGFENGLSGIGYMLLYLIENEIIDADFEEIFGSQCEKIIGGFEHIDKQPDKLLASLKAICFLSELNKTKNEDIRIKSIIEKIFQGVELYLSIQFFDWKNIGYIGHKTKVLEVYETYLKLVDFSEYSDFSVSLINDYAELYRENKMASSLSIGHYLRSITTKNDLSSEYNDIIDSNINSGLKNIYPSSLSLNEKLNLAKVLNDMDNSYEIDLFAPKNNLSRPASSQLDYQLDTARYLIYRVNKNNPLL
jgi:GT2 family glycosyltransferase